MMNSVKIPGAGPGADPVGDVEMNEAAVEPKPKRQCIRGTDYEA